MTPGDWVDLVGTALALVVGLYQCWVGQAWKRAEFVANEFNAFVGRPAIRAAIWPPTGTVANSFYRRRSVQTARHPSSFWATDIWPRSLSPTRTRSDRSFTAEKPAIRDVFDGFFDGLERFENFIQAGLIEWKDCAPYLRYWLRILGDPSLEWRDPPFRKHVTRYLSRYNYTGVQSLPERCRREEGRAQQAGQGNPSNSARGGPHHRSP